MSDTALFIFRQDLRTLDNLALSNACQNHESVVCIYILDDSVPIGSASKWWLHHSLKSLSEKLPISFFHGATKDVVAKLVSQHKIENIYLSKSYDPSGIKIEKSLSGYKLHSYPGSYLIEPANFMNKSGFPYTVFTPFWRSYTSSNPRFIKPSVADVSNVVKVEGGVSLDALELLPKIHWDKTFYDIWTPGEEGAHKRLEGFIAHKLHGYGSGRDYPHDNHTSLLSPHLHFGEISPNTIAHAIGGVVGAIDATKFMSEIGWREFSNYLLFHHPRIVTENFKPLKQSANWKYDEVKFKAWCKGETGYPIIDAGMRELWQTGYMHNRVRMLVASFLTKNLSMDWRLGADWFFDTLVDADMANNICSWQWVAGCGADAMPYYRVFNPVLQSKRFDADGLYIKKWVPELKDVQTKYIYYPRENAIV